MNRRILSHFTFLLLLGLPFVVTEGAQNPPLQELGAIQGAVTRAGTDDTIGEVQVALEGGAIDPQVMRSLLNSAAGFGIVVTPPEGASVSEVTQLLISQAATRGLPVGPPAITNLVNSAVGGSKWPTTLTDRTGRFVFRDVRPGKYTLRATRDGYFGKPVNGAYPPNAAIDIAIEGKETRDASLAMVQGGLVSGRVYGANGDLLSNVNVQAFTVDYQNGFAQLLATASKATDDRGEYRLFWVPPGDYYVGASPRNSARTFYPGVARLNDAIRVTIRGGDDLSGMNINIQARPTFKISGLVTTTVPPVPDATTLPSAALLMVGRDLNTPDDGVARNAGNVPLISSTGVIEVSGIAPGTYELFARIPDPAGQGLTGFAWGHVSIDIQDQDVTGVAIAVNPSVEVKGIVRGAGAAKVPANVRLVLLPQDGPSKIPLYRFVATRGTPIAADGSFAVVSVPPGRFRVGTLSGLASGQYIADVRQDGRSVFDSGFEVGGRTPNPLEITIGAGASVVQGVVRDGPTRTMAGATVVLAPESARIENRALYATTTTDASGSFVLRGVAPGNYRLLAWETVPPNAYQNVGFMEKVLNQGRAIRVEPVSMSTVEIPVIHN